MPGHRGYFFMLLIALISWRAYGADPKDAHQTWYFAAAGDSRNCGDIVMPAIAADAQTHNVQFYWHLGDIRKTSSPDQDFIAEKRIEGHPTNLADYESQEWDDFIENQIKAWGSTPFYLGIGNHETTKPKSRAAFVESLRTYLDLPNLRAQRMADNPKATEPRTYFHWMRDGVDFIFLDNATADQFDSAQMEWIKGVLERDAKDNSLRTVVVGMHEALPNSISANHSMNESAYGIESGLRVYDLLLKLQNQDHKLVYVLASHSHYFMDGTFNTQYWKDHGGVLPGWIVGTAGAQRYPLPPDAHDAKEAKTNVYGYLLATVNPAGEPAGTVKFDFVQIEEGQISDGVKNRFGADTVHECFVGNRKKSQLD